MYVHWALLIQNTADEAKDIIFMVKTWYSLILPLSLSLSNFSDIQKERPEIKEISFNFYCLQDNYLLKRLKDHA